MQITPVNNVNFSARKPVKRNQFVSEPQENNNKKTAGLVIATALAAATLGGVIVHHRRSKESSAVEEGLRRQLNRLYNSAPYSENRSLREQVANLTTDNEALNNTNKALRKTIEEKEGL